MMFGGSVTTEDTQSGNVHFLGGGCTFYNDGKISPVWWRGGRCTQGGFNVSNLVGFKRRMIDIGKK
jgi:hypothetical protein